MKKMFKKYWGYAFMALMAAWAISTIMVVVQGINIRSGYKKSKELKVEFYSSEWARFEWDDPDDYSSDIQRGTVYYDDGCKSIRTYVLDKDGGYPIMTNAVLVYPDGRVING